ncbi:hypothetical protein HL42_2532 [Trichophyton rubrum]|nr:hypothetical protein HL42_2532 [Trichophyton rubrum]
MNFDPMAQIVRRTEVGHAGESQIPREARNEETHTFPCEGTGKQRQRDKKGGLMKLSASNPRNSRGSTLQTIRRCCIPALSSPAKKKRPREARLGSADNNKNGEEPCLYVVQLRSDLQNAG